MLWEAVWFGVCSVVVWELSEVLLLFFEADIVCLYAELVKMYRSLGPVSLKSELFFVVLFSLLLLFRAAVGKFFENLHLF